EPDSYHDALDALAAKRFQAAIINLQQFISSSVGDPRADTAQKLLHDSKVALARQYESTDREIDAATLYLEVAGEANLTADMKDTYRKLASQSLTAAFADAQQKRLPD